MMGFIIERSVQKGYDMYKRTETNKEKVDADEFKDSGDYIYFHKDGKLVKTLEKGTFDDLYEE